MCAGLRQAPSSVQQRVPCSRQFGPRLARCSARLCSLGSEGKGRIAPSSHLSLGWAVSTQHVTVTLNPQLTCEAGMEQSSVRPPPL